MMPLLWRTFRLDPLFFFFERSEEFPSLLLRGGKTEASELNGERRVSGRELFLVIILGILTGPAFRRRPGPEKFSFCLD